MWFQILTTSILTTVMTASQTIQIHDMTRNSGLLTLQTGNTLVKTGRHRIYHAVDLDKYQPVLDNIQIALDGLRIFPDIADLTYMLRTKLEKTVESYKRLLPLRTHRHKRGALNFLGSAIKVITGNLDNNDLIQINDDLNTLLQDNQELIKQNNIQVTFNKQLEKRINSIIDSVNRQQNIIKQQIITARQSFIINKLINQNFTAIRQIFKISYHLDLLDDHLNSIFEVIQLAKIHTISKNFLESEELKFILARLEEENIPIINPDQAYDYLDIRTISKGNTLYFIIGVPQISKQTFSNLLLEPLPVDGKVIKLPWHQAATNGNFTYFLMDDCQYIGGNTICDEEKLQDVSGDECFSKILRGLPGKCTFTNYLNISNIKRLTDNHVVIKNASVTLQTDCLHNSRNLSGTFVIFFSNCSIMLNRKSYRTVTVLSKALQSIIPLDGVKIEQSDFESSISLHELERMHTQTRELLRMDRRRYNFQTSTSLGLSSSCIIIGFFIALYLWCKNRSSSDETKLNINIQGPTINPTNKVESGRLKLEDGLVNDGNIDRPTRNSADQPKMSTEELINRWVQQK